MIEIPRKEKYTKHNFENDLAIFKIRVENGIYGVFQYLEINQITPTIREELKDIKRTIFRGGRALEIEHVLYTELDGKGCPLCTVVLTDDIVANIKDLSAEELNIVYNIVYSFI